MKFNKILIILLLTLMTIASTRATTIGEMHITMGGIYPQGTYNAFTDNGFTANLRWTIHMNQFKFFSGWFNINGSFFSSEESYVRIIGDPYISGADQRISEYSFALHTGIQLGSDTRQGFLRPRLAIGPGIYFFITEDVLTVPGMEEPYADENNTQVKFGYRAFGGVDMFFSKKWGVTFSVVYDHVLSLDHTLEVQDGRVIKIPQTARYNSFGIGVVIALDE